MNWNKTEWGRKNSVAATVGLWIQYITRMMGMSCTFLLWISQNHYYINLVTICTDPRKSCLNFNELGWNRFGAFELDQSVFYRPWYRGRPEKLENERRTFTKWTKKSLHRDKNFTLKPSCRYSLCTLASSLRSPFGSVFRRFTIRFTMENEQINFCK